VREERSAVTTKGANGEVISSTEESGIRPNTEVRLGAIYALERLAHDDLTMHWPIMETLCAYIRENAGPPMPVPSNIVSALAKSPQLRSKDERAVLSAYRDELASLSVDIQAALSVIGRRGPAQLQYELAQRNDTGAIDGAWCLDLRNCSLIKSNLAGFDLAYAMFDGSALYGASFYNAKLRGARFFKAKLEDVHFSRAQMEGAWLGLAHLEGASLAGAFLQGASLNEARLSGAILGGAVLTDSRLDGADLSNGRGVADAALSAAWGDVATRLPSHSARPENERWVTAEVGSKEWNSHYSNWGLRRKFWLAGGAKQREVKQERL
jgi:hypothetical protein